MKIETQRNFVAANIALLYDYKLNDIYREVWLAKFGQTFRVESNRTHGRGYEVKGLGRTFVDPDHETVEDAVARVTEVFNEHYEDRQSLDLYNELDGVAYRFTHIEMGESTRLKRGDHDLPRILGVLQYVATGEIAKDYKVVNEFIDTNDARESFGLKAFSGTFCGLQLKGFKNGRLDVSGLSSDQQGRLAHVYNLANKRF